MREQPITDAEVVSEGPKPPPPPPREAKLEPAGAGEAFSVFDGPVKDAPNATAKPNEARKKAAQSAKARRGGGKKAPPPPAAAAGPAAPPGVDPAVVQRMKAEASARRVLQFYEGWQVGNVRSRYGEILDPASLEQLCAGLKYSPEQLKAMSECLGEGFVEQGVEMPWWMTFGAMFLTDLAVKRAALMNVERAYQEHLKRKEAAAAPAAPSSPA